MTRQKRWRVVLSRYQNRDTRNHGANSTQAATIAACHTVIASQRNWIASIGSGGSIRKYFNRLENSPKGIKAVIALSVQRAYVVMNKPDRAESLSRYVGRIDPAYALNKALTENDLPAALKATEIAVRSGALHAFLDLYQDAPAYPDSAF